MLRVGDSCNQFGRIPRSFRKFVMLHSLFFAHAVKSCYLPFSLSWCVWSTYETVCTHIMTQLCPFIYSFKSWGFEIHSLGYSWWLTKWLYVCTTIIPLNAVFSMFLDLVYFIQYVTKCLRNLLQSNFFFFDT